MRWENLFVTVLPPVLKPARQRDLVVFFVDLTGPRSVASVGGVHYMMIVRDDFSRFTWLYGLKSKSSSAFAFRKFLADVRVDVTQPRVEIARSDNGKEFSGGILSECVTS